MQFYHPGKKCGNFCLVCKNVGFLMHQFIFSSPDVPGKPGRAVVTQSSGSEVFLTWSGPVSDGNSYILGYRIDYKKTGNLVARDVIKF